MSAVVYCLFPCCPSSDYHRCLLFLQCISTDLQCCHATNPAAAPILSAALLQSSQRRLFHVKSHYPPSYSVVCSLLSWIKKHADKIFNSSVSQEKLFSWDSVVCNSWRDYQVWPTRALWVYPCTSAERSGRPQVWEPIRQRASPQMLQCG